MMEKSIKNLSIDPAQYLKEMVRFTLDNRPQRVDIINNKDIIKAAFDGPGIASKEDFRGLLINIYNSESSDQDMNSFGALGRSVVALLKQNPLEVIVKTHDDKSAYVMKIDSRLEPEIFTLDKLSDENSITLVKRRTKKGDLKAIRNAFRYTRKTAVSDAVLDLFNETVSTIHSVGENIIYPLIKSIKQPIAKIHFSSKISNTLEDICAFSDVPVYLNKRKISKGLTFDDSIYQRTYKFDDISILFSIPKDDITRDYKKTIYLKNGIFMHQHCQYKRNNNSWEYAGIPDIAIDAPGISLVMSGEKIHKDYYFRSLDDKIDKASQMFFKDVLTNLSEIEDHGWLEGYNFIRASISKEYNILQKEGIIHQVKLFADTEGNKYTLHEVEEALKKQTGIYTVRKKINRNHPAINDEKGIVFYLKSGTESYLFEKLFLSNAHEMHKSRRLDDIIDKYESDKRSRHIKITKNALKAVGTGTGYTAASAGTFAASYYGTIVLVPYILEYWHYGAIASAGSLGVCVAAKGASVATKSIAKGTGAAARSIAKGTGTAARSIVKAAPAAWERTSHILRYLGDTINYNRWMNKGVGYFGNIIKTNKLFEPKVKKKIHHKEKPESMIDDNIEKYISALKENISFNKGQSNFKDYFHSIYKVTIEDKGFFSRLFSLHNVDKLGNSSYELRINTARQSLYKKAKLFAESSSSIYYDLLRIGKMLKESGAWVHNTISLERCILDAVHSSSLDDVAESFSRGEESFKEDFQMLSDSERKNIIKKILSKEIVSGNGLGEWLVVNHNVDIEYVARESMTGAYFGKIMSYLENSMVSAAKYEYGLLTAKEKLDFITKLKEKKDSSQDDNNNKSINELDSYIEYNDKIIGAYHQLIHRKLNHLKSRFKPCKRVPAFRYRRIIRQIQPNYIGSSLEDFLVLSTANKLINQNHFRDSDSYNHEIIHKIFSKPGCERSGLLETAKRYMCEHEYRQLEGLVKVSEV